MRGYFGGYHCHSSYYCHHCLGWQRPTKEEAMEDLQEYKKELADELKDIEKEINEMSSKDQT